MNNQGHWQHVYETKADADLSWHQDSPTRSLALIDSLRPQPRRVIDVGGGQSSLAASLIDRGVAHVTVLDISAAALERGRARLAQPTDRIRWLAADILESSDVGTFDLWHDRAVFHFLTSSLDQIRYVETASKAVHPDGHAIVATFAPNGPEKCSGLPVCRYDSASLSRTFAPSFALVDSVLETHVTPWGKPQAFTYVLLRRNAE